MNFPFFLQNSVVCINEASLCLLCGVCVEACPTGALEMSSTHPVVDGKKCCWCASCAKLCPTGALKPSVSGEESGFSVADWLLPPSLYGSEKGFREVLPDSLTRNAAEEYQTYLESARAAFHARGGVNPVVLSACPAVERFIRTNLPQFAHWLHDSLPPMELTARRFGGDLTFVAPCPAKVMDIGLRIDRGESFIRQALPGDLVIHKLGLSPVFEKKNTEAGGLIRIAGLTRLAEWLMNRKEGQDSVEIVEALSCPDCSEGYFFLRSGF